VRAFSLEEVEQTDGPAPFSLHDVGLDAMLSLARELDELPDAVRIVGIQPERFDQGDRLSPAVEAAVGPAADAVVNEIQKLM
jgi:hydrogenase maturation protease